MKEYVATDADLRDFYKLKAKLIEQEKRKTKQKKEMQRRSCKK